MLAVAVLLIVSWLLVPTFVQLFVFGLIKLHRVVFSEISK